jgi:hypothetical protein
MAMSGIAGASGTAVEEALREYARSRKGRFEPTTAPKDPSDVMVIGEAEGDRITVAYPGEFLGWNKASEYLSRRLHAPVFSFHIHDGDLWMYTLFFNGEEVDHFNPIPDYWSDDLSDEEREQWEGNAEVVAKFWPGVTSEAVENYLVAWDLEEEPGKAYDDDQYVDCWQVVDFMRRLGLAYPFDDRGRALGATYRFEASS